MQSYLCTREKYHKIVQRGQKINRNNNMQMVTSHETSLATLVELSPTLRGGGVLTPGAYESIIKMHKSKF
jgi:hypothetical protein